MKDKLKHYEYFSMMLNDIAALVDDLTDNEASEEAISLCQQLFNVARRDFDAIFSDEFRKTRD